MAQRFKAKTLLSNSGRFNDEVIAPNLVYNTGNQTISGTKTFDVAPILGGNQLITGNLSLYATNANLISTGSRIDILSGNLITTGSRIDSLSGEVVFNTGNQTIGGLKTFSNGIISSVGISGSNLVYNTGNQIISGIKTFATGIVAPNIVYNTGDQTVNGLKAFSQGISVTGGIINLIGKHSIGVGRQTGESIILRGGSGVSDGNVMTSRAKGGDIILIPGNAVSGGMFENTQGNILLSGTSGAFPLSYVGMADEGGRSRINIVGGAANDDPRGGHIVIEGNLHINPSNSIGTRRGTRNFTIYKSGSVIAGAVNFKVTEDSVTVNNPIYANNLVYNTGNQTISGVKTFATGVVIPNIVYNTGTQTISGIKTFSTELLAPNIVYNTGTQNISGVKTFANPVFISNISGVSGSGISIITDFASSNGDLGNSIIISSASGSTIGGNVNLYAGNSASVPGNLRLYAGRNNATSKGTIYLDGDIQVNPFFGAAGSNQHNSSITIYKTGTYGLASDILTIDQSNWSF